MIRHYIKTSFRHLGKHKAQNILSVLGVAVGLICFSITTYFVLRMNDQYSGHPQYKHIARFYTLQENESQPHPYLLNWEVDKIMSNPIDGILKIGFYSGSYSNNFSFEKEDGSYIPFRCRYNFINRNFLDIFSSRSIFGQRLPVNDGEAVITQSWARKIYGNENPVGKTLHFSLQGNSSLSPHYYRIADVIHDLPPVDGRSSNIFIIRESSSENVGTDAIALLSEGVTVENINQRLKVQVPGLGLDGKKYPVIQTYQELLLKESRLIQQTLTVFIASLVLIAALINFLKFNINSFYNRTREVSLRKSLGARRRDLFNMLFSEIILLLLLITLLSYCIIEIAVPLLQMYIPEAYRGDELFMIDTNVLCRQQIMHLIALLVICSSIIWIAIQRASKLNIIKGIRSNGKGKHGIRNTMLGLQIFICFFFVGMAAGPLLSYRYADKHRFYTLSPEESEQIWRIRLSEPQLWGHETEIIDKIRQLTYVKDILFEDYARLANYIDPKKNNFQCYLKEVPENYFEFMNLPVEGNMPKTETEIVISRLFAKQLEKDSIRGNVEVGGRTYQITGIIEEEPFARWNKKDRASLFFALKGKTNFPNREFFVKCIPGKETEVKSELTKIIRTYLPASIPFYIESHKKLIEQEYIGIKLLGDLFLLFSFISIVITVLGIYSAITMDTESRQKEMAIRKINGAKQKDIIRLFGKLYIKLTLIGSFFALPAVYLLLDGLLGSESLNAPLYNPVFWISVFIIVTFILFATVAYRIWLISRINPAEVIKSE